MSYTEMFKVSKSGLVEEIAEFGNAFRGAFLIWDNMAKKYLGQPAGLLMATGNMGQVWGLAKRQDILLAHRIVLMSTLDRVMVRRENLYRVIEAIETYAETFDPGTLLIQAKKLRELCNDQDCQAVCWNQTSVNAAYWWIDDGSDDGYGRPYDITRDTGHWFLFDREWAWKW